MGIILASRDDKYSGHDDWRGTVFLTGLRPYSAISVSYDRVELRSWRTSWCAVFRRNEEFRQDAYFFLQIVGISHEASVLPAVGLCLEIAFTGWLCQEFSAEVAEAWPDLDTDLH